MLFRSFKDLRTLSLSGNPVAEAEDYRTCICAYLPDLVYLDFRRIDDQTVAWPSCVQLRGQRAGPGVWGGARPQEEGRAALLEVPLLPPSLSCHLPPRGHCLFFWVNKSGNQARVGD